MARLLLLTLTGALIFVGFAIPFFIQGALGLSFGVVLGVIGAVIFWTIENRTRKSLSDDNRLNRVLKSDGDDIIDRKP